MIKVKLTDRYGNEVPDTKLEIDESLGRDFIDDTILDYLQEKRLIVIQVQRPNRGIKLIVQKSGCKCNEHSPLNWLNEKGEWVCRLCEFEPVAQ
jgi:hypothetical protein